MGNYIEIKGDIIGLALKGQFDVIGHCTNALCVMGGGMSVPMRKTFKCNEYPMEQPSTKGDINKLGQIDWAVHSIKDGQLNENYTYKALPEKDCLAVVNMYGQYNYASINDKAPLDYEALRLCMRKMNYIFKGKKIGLPYVIGCGLAGGNKDIVIQMIKDEFIDCDVTMVDFNR